MAKGEARKQTAKACAHLVCEQIISDGYFVVGGEVEEIQDMVECLVIGYLTKRDE